PNAFPDRSLLNSRPENPELRGIERRAKSVRHIFELIDNPPVGQGLVDGQGAGAVRYRRQMADQAPERVDQTLFPFSSPVLQHMGLRSGSPDHIVADVYIPVQYWID